MREEIEKLRDTIKDTIERVIEAEGSNSYKFKLLYVDIYCLEPQELENLPIHIERVIEGKIDDFKLCEDVTTEIVRVATKVGLTYATVVETDNVDEANEKHALGNDIVLIYKFHGEELEGRVRIEMIPLYCTSNPCEVGTFISMTFIDITPSEALLRTLLRTIKAVFSIARAKN